MNERVNHGSLEVFQLAPESFDTDLVALLKQFLPIRLPFRQRPGKRIHRLQIYSKPNNQNRKPALDRFQCRRNIPVSFSHSPNKITVLFHLFFSVKKCQRDVSQELRVGLVQLPGTLLQSLKVTLSKSRFYGCCVFARHHQLLQFPKRFTNPKSPAIDLSISQQTLPAFLRSLSLRPY